MHNFMKSLAVACFFAAAAMIVALPATAGTQGKADTKQTKKEETKTAGCCADKKGADAKACADGKDCCADGKEGKHSKADHEKMMKEKEGEKKDEVKKDGDGR